MDLIEGCVTKWPNWNQQISNRHHNRQTLHWVFGVIMYLSDAWEPYGKTDYKTMLSKNAKSINCVSDKRILNWMVINTEGGCTDLVNMFQLIKLMVNRYIWLYVPINNAWAYQPLPSGWVVPYLVRRTNFGLQYKIINPSLNNTQHPHLNDQFIYDFGLEVYCG